VPHLSVSIDVLLSIVSVGVLIYLIHHLSVSIQADQVVARVGKELDNGIDSLFPGNLGNPGSEAYKAPSEATLPGARARGPSCGCRRRRLSPADRCRYLMTLACEEDLLLRLERRPGHDLIKGRAMVMVWPGHRVTTSLVDRMNAAFVIGNQRAPAQDIEFPIHQLVEIALRALSPGINDPFSAIACVWIGWDRPCTAWTDATCHDPNDSTLVGGCGW
jgi:uncharacterized membrane protein